MALSVLKAKTMGTSIVRHKVFLYIYANTVVRPIAIKGNVLTNILPPTLAPCHHVLQLDTTRSCSINTATYGQLVR